MKKISFIIIAIAIIGFGCKKQDTIPQTEIGDPTAAKIEQFLKDVESTNKSGTDLTITDAIWNVEAALNYAYCDVSTPYINRYTDTINFEIPVTNSMVNWNDVVSLYDYCLQEMNTFASTFNFTNHFVVIDLENKKIENGNMTIKLYAVLGETDDVRRSNPNTRSFIYFGSTDWWKYGEGPTNNGGKCHGYSGYTNLDAAIKIAGKINYSLTPIVGTYFTDLLTRYDVNPITYPLVGDGNWDNYCDYKMFYNRTDWSNFHECVSPTEMNYHLDGTNSVLFTYVANNGPRPAGKNPISITLEGIYTSLQLDNVTPLIIHNGDFTYGIEHHSR